MKVLKNIYNDYIAFPKYVIFHPFDGFEDLKRNKKGKLSVALVFIFLFIIFRIMKFSYESPIINDVNPLDLNSIKEILTVVMIVGLFSVANWSVTTIMSGKGNYKEILTVTGYSLFPIVIIGIPAVLISNLLTIEEMAIYQLIIGMAYVATGWTLFMGVLNIHEYGLFKTIGSLFLTILAMAVMIFFALLFFSLIQEIFYFIKVLWQEINLRL
ncbi:YIP1 family protein [Haploplasma modicum]|uniref:YIP1 family protein n=1 Tax=Haploplasma modicum TaxID=2150 RepID=UPI00214C2417|nr:YIP1 family protein [Haploplasma modicum]MCR1809446.1 YIP1 family protein [Haploplasma modicum]